MVGGGVNDMINTCLKSNKNNNHENLKDTSRIIVKGKFIMLNVYLLRTREGKLIKHSTRFILSLSLYNYPMENGLKEIIKIEIEISHLENTTALEWFKEMFLK